MQTANVMLKIIRCGGSLSITLISLGRWMCLLISMKYGQHLLGVVEKNVLAYLFEIWYRV